jgi:HlyD family secretion protein
VVSSRRARFLTAGIVLTIGAAGGFAWRSRSAGRDDCGVITAAVDRGAIVASVVATGTVTPLNTVAVGTYVSGPILAIDVDYNSPVRKGQRVAKIDPAPFEMRVRKSDANLENARARLVKSRADLALKKKTLERMAELREKEIASENDYDVAKSNYDQAAADIRLSEAAVTQADAELQEARINLGYTEIVSPVDGVVVSRNVNVGQTVAATFQTPTLFEIAEDLTKMQVNTSVSESDIGEVAEGQPATFLVDAWPDREFHGTVTQVRNAPTMIQNVVTYVVVVGADNPKAELKPGMTANVTITTARKDDVIRVPARALRFDPGTEDAAPRTARGGKPSLWVVRDGCKPEPVQVETGLRDDRWVEVTAGAPEPGTPVAIALREPDKAEKPAGLPFMPRRR